MSGRLTAMPRYVRPPTAQAREREDVLDALLSTLGRAIVRQLAVAGPQTTGELMRILGDVAPMTLRARMRSLESAHLITGDMAPESRNGRRVKYDVDLEAVRRVIADLDLYLTGQPLL